MQRNGISWKNAGSVQYLTCLLYTSNQNGYSRILSEAVLIVAEFISYNRNFEKEGYIGILERVKKLIDLYKFQGAFDSQQVNLLEHYIQILQTRVIFQNFSNMTYILNVVFDKRITLQDNMNICLLYTSRCV